MSASDVLSLDEVDTESLYVYTADSTMHVAPVVGASMLSGDIVWTVSDARLRVLRGMSRTGQMHGYLEPGMYQLLLDGIHQIVHASHYVRPRRLFATTRRRVCDDPSVIVHHLHERLLQCVGASNTEEKPPCLFPMLVTTHPSPLDILHGILFVTYLSMIHYQTSGDDRLLLSVDAVYHSSVQSRLAKSLSRTARGMLAATYAEFRRTKRLDDSSRHAS